MQSHSSSFFSLSIIVHLIVLPIFGSKFMVMILYDDSLALNGVVWEIRIYNSGFSQSELNYMVHSVCLFHHNNFSCLGKATLLCWQSTLCNKLILFVTRIAIVNMALQDDTRIVPHDR